MKDHDTIPTRSSLLGRVKDLDNQEAWREFCAVYRRLLTRLALKAGLREDEADEVVQEVFISVTRNIGDFHYDPDVCSFKHWLSQMVRWRIQDQYKKRRSAESVLLDAGGEKADSTSVEPVDANGFDLGAVWETEWKQHLIEVASERVKKQVSAKQFQIFYLHVLKEIAVDEVCQRLKVSRAQVYLAKLRVGRLFRQHIEALENTLA